MYRAFYGLRERPFELTSNVKYFLATRGHQEALSNVEYALSASTGIALLLGEAGTGKTSVLRKALAELSRTPEAVSTVYINNPTLSVGEFLATLAHGFQLSPGAATAKPQLLRELEQALLLRRSNGCVSVLVVDEAQSLPDALLEEVRLLSNMEVGTERLLRIVLAGQAVLGQRLNDPGLGQLKQRIDLRCVLPALSLQQTASYIARRIVIAGGTPAVAFSRDAVALIHERSGGIPRTINVLCANALLSGFALGQRPVNADTVLEVCADFDLHGGPAGLADSAAFAPAPNVPSHAFGTPGEAAPVSSRLASSPGARRR